MIVFDLGVIYILYPQRNMVDIVCHFCLVDFTENFDRYTRVVQ